MTPSQKKITLILPQTEVPRQYVDRGGGETNALPGFVKSAVARAVEIDPAVLETNIAQALEQMKQVFSNLRATTMDGWKVGGVTIGFTVTAEGSVGVATAGVEASIEIEFAPA